MVTKHTVLSIATGRGNDATVVAAHRGIYLAFDINARSPRGSVGYKRVYAYTNAAQARSDIVFNQIMNTVDAIEREAMYAPLPF